MAEFLTRFDDILYTWCLIYMLAGTGIYFTVLTKGVQVRLFGESLRLLKEPPEDKKNEGIRKTVK